MKMFTKISFFPKLKSRLKHLTLLDGLVLFAVLSVILLFTYFFFRTNVYRTITIKVGESNVLWPQSSRAWFSYLFRPGMKEKDGFGFVTAEVLHVFSYDLDSSMRNLYLSLRVKTTYNRASGQYIYRGKPVLIGSTIKLFLDELLVDGLVTNMEGVQDPREKKILTVETQLREETVIYPETAGARPYIADAVQEGDEYKDSNDNVIIKILKKRTQDSQKSVTTSDGRILIQAYPLRKDVYLTLEVHAIKIHNRFYVYDDMPIVIGAQIPINTSTVSVFPEVTKIITE